MAFTNILDPSVGGTVEVTEMESLANGTIIVGDGTGAPTTLAALTSSTGALKHEYGGVEANISAIADGGVVVGTGVGTMAIRAGVLTAGAAGYIKHELGGLEADVSAYAGLVKISGGATSAVAATANGESLITAADYAAMKALLDLEIGTDVQAYSATLAAVAGGTYAGDDSIVTVGTLSAGNVDAAVSAASTTIAGKMEASIASEVDTGTDTARAVTPDSLAGSNFGERAVVIYAVDGTTDTAVGDGKAYFTVPSSMAGMDLVEVHARVVTAGTTNTLDIQIANVTQAADMLSTKITIDTTETGSETAATAAVIDTNNDDVAANDLIRIDIDAVHTTAAKGLIVTLIFRLP